MTIEITIQKTQILLCRHGVCTSLVSAPMRRRQAEALVPQYGFRPDEVVLVRQIEMRHRRHVDNQALQEVLDRYPFNPNRTRQELLEIIRTHFYPQATKIMSNE